VAFCAFLDALYSSSFVLEMRAFSVVVYPNAFPLHFSPQREKKAAKTRQRLEKRAMTTTAKAAVVVKTVAPNHFCLDQNVNPRVVRTIATSLPWYGPKFSPHDVPNFYDVSGITENPEAFKLVVDTFAERYESMKEKPTKIVGFDARGFLFGPTIAMRLGTRVGVLVFGVRLM
jgi:hypothetical protein